METKEEEKSHAKGTQSSHQHPTTNGSDQITPTSSDVVHVHAWHSHLDCSNRPSSSIPPEQTELNGGVSESLGRRPLCISDCLLEVDSEVLVPEVKINVVVVEKDCRICHLSLEEIQETGIPIELGCSCKDDLAAVHKQCAEAWFRIKGNKICEICGSTAKNVGDIDKPLFIEQMDETGSGPPLPPRSGQTGSFWHGHRFLNFLLACVVFAFVISWLFHFNMPH